MIETTIVFYPMVDIKTNKQLNITSYLGYKRSILFSKKKFSINANKEVQRFNSYNNASLRSHLVRAVYLVNYKQSAPSSAHIYISSPVFIITQLLKLHNLLGAFHLLEKIEEDKAYFFSV